MAGGTLSDVMSWCTPAQRIMLVLLPSLIKSVMLGAIIACMAGLIGTDWRPNREHPRTTVQFRVDGVALVPSSGVLPAPAGAPGGAARGGDRNRGSSAGAGYTGSAAAAGFNETALIERIANRITPDTETRNRIKKQIGFGVPQRVALVQCTVPNSWLEDWVFATHERMKAIGMGHIPHVVLTRAGSWNQTEADRYRAKGMRARDFRGTWLPKNLRQWAAKYALWELLEYDRLIFVDTDIVLLRSIEHILYIKGPEVLMVPDPSTGYEMNGGIMVMSPSKAGHAAIRRATLAGSLSFVDYGTAALDQSVINRVNMLAEGGHDGAVGGVMMLSPFYNVACRLGPNSEPIPWNTWEAKFYKKVLGNNRSLGIMAHVYAVHFLDRKPITLRTLDRSKAEPATEMCYEVMEAQEKLVPLDAQSGWRDTPLGTPYNVPLGPAFPDDPNHGMEQT